MTDDAVTGAAGEELAAFIEMLSEELGGPPRLGELLELLAWGAGSLAEDLEPPPPVVVELVPRLRRGSTPSKEPSRVGDLNDSVVVDAGDLLSRLARGLRQDGARPSLEDLVSLVGGAIRALPDGALADVEPADVTGLTVRRTKAPKKPAVGDVVAIPAADGGHHLAVVVDRTVFGTALGLFRGTHPPRPPRPDSAPPVVEHPVYTDDDAVAAGRWGVVGHDEDLAQLFPRQPEILHRPRPDMASAGIGPYGAAERPDGSLRDLDEEEARARGVLEPDFQQVYAGAQLERHLPRLTG